MTDTQKDPIPFEMFASFKRIETGNPIISLPPPSGQQRPMPLSLMGRYITSGVSETLVFVG